MRQEGYGASLAGPGSQASPEVAEASSPFGFDPSRDMDDAYRCVGEILEYFDRHSLATWAPVAAIIRRERNRGRTEGLTEYEPLIQALQLAANRLASHAVNAISAGDRRSSEYTSWADDALLSVAKTRASEVETTAILPPAGGGLTLVQYWFAPRKISRLDVPGRKNGRQRIEVEFFDGDSVGVESGSIGGAWRALRELALDMNPPASRTAARSDETARQAQPEGQGPDPKGDAQ